MHNHIILYCAVLYCTDLQVRQAFLDSLAELRATGRSYLVPPKAPQFGVGHSNGALLHLLINSYEPGATDANVIISYNNL